MGYNASGVIGAVGKIDTGHRLNAIRSKYSRKRNFCGEFCERTETRRRMVHAGWRGQLDRAGPVNVGLVNNATAASGGLSKKGYVTGVLFA